MKQIFRLNMLILTFVVFALMTVLLTPKSVQAAHSSQSIDDRIKATLEEANRSLGGGFVWDSVDWTMKRSKNVGINNVGSPVELTEYLQILLGNSCESLGWQSITFHEMEGCARYDGNHLGDLVWTPKNGVEFDGMPITFSVRSMIGYDCSGNHSAEDEKRASCDSENALPLAEALHQAAIHNGLYEPMPNKIQPVVPEEISPTEQGATIPAQPETPADQSMPSDSSNGQFSLPAAVALGSLVVPVAGAMAGAVISSLFSLLGSSNSIASVTQSAVTSTPATGSNQDLYGAEKQALQQNEAELQNKAEELVKLQAETKLTDLKNDLEAINKELLDKNIYVVNPLQGDPTLIFDGLSKITNIGWDNTVGLVTNSTGFTCGDYVNETLGKVKSIIAEKYGSKAKAEGYVFEEKSTRNPQGILDWFDKLNDDNHTLIKVTLPDGSEWGVDFHQHNTGKHPPILRPWQEVRKEWKDYMGDEFTGRLSIP